jgi:hypothetical protein
MLIIQIDVMIKVHYRLVYTKLKRICQRKSQEEQNKRNALEAAPLVLELRSQVKKARLTKL